MLLTTLLKLTIVLTGTLDACWSLISSQHQRIQQQRPKQRLSALPLSDADNHDDPNASQHKNLRRDILRTSSTAALSAFLSGYFPLYMTANALEDVEMKRINIFEKTSPSVVFIDTFTSRRDAFTTNILEVPLGSGSGFIWDKQGHIVTNFHVVRNAKAAQIAILNSGKNVPGTLNPGSGSEIVMNNPYALSSRGAFGTASSGNIQRSIFKASVVGVDPGKDIAVLKVDAPADLLSPVSLGTSKGLKVGQTAMAIGNPFGLDHTLTTGIISGTGREVKSPIGRPITNVIQTDAAINPGNSGGVLLDSSGKLIGMNTAIYSPSGASAGIGFAIPIDSVKTIVDTLIRDGKVVRPILGIAYLENRQARTLGINSGVLVLEVPTGSPSAIAGLRGTRRTESGLVELGDIIVKVGNKVINVESDLFQSLEEYKPGDVVSVTVNRVSAVNDELQMATLVIDIPLQASTSLEKQWIPQELSSKELQQESSRKVNPNSSMRSIGRA